VLTRRQRNGLRVGADRAAQAPSVHNTQPWRFDLHQDRLELWLDRTRQLTAADPQGRELVMSVGAALLNARVGIASVHQACSVDRFPDPAQPDLAAVVRPALADAEPGLAALDPLVPLRRSNRSDYAGAAPTEVVELLRAAAAAEDVVLHPFDESQQRALARLVHVARAVQECDEAYERELRIWTSRPARLHDGMRREPTGTARTGSAAVPLRDFGAGPVLGDDASGGPRGQESVLVLATRGDTPGHWLRAGEALERVLLEVVRLGWQAGLVTQPVEVPATRTDLAKMLPPGLEPQAVLRVGRAEPPHGIAPRRCTADVLRDLTAFPEAGPGPAGTSASGGQPRS